MQGNATETLTDKEKCAIELTRAEKAERELADAREAIVTLIRFDKFRDTTSLLGKNWDFNMQRIIDAALAVKGGD